MYQDMVKSRKYKMDIITRKPYAPEIHPENAKQGPNPTNKTNDKTIHTLQLLKGNVWVQHVKNLVALAVRLGR
jgi:hypothetical protein